MFKKLRPERGLLCFYFSGQARETLCWTYRSAGGESCHGDAADAIPAAAGNRVWLAIPAERCLFSSVAGGRMSAEALKWQLEDSALGDVGELHLTLLGRDARQNHLVAVNHASLRDAIDAVKRLGFTPQYALPDVLLLPRDSSLRLQKQWLVRTGLYCGVSVSVDDLPLLQAHDSSFSTWEQWPASCSLLGESSSIRLPSLLHGAFAPPVNWQRSVRRHLTALALACGCLLLTPLYQAWQLKRETDAIHQQMLQRYQHYFPRQTPAEPAAAFIQQLQRLEARQLPPGLLALLAESTALLEDLNETPLQTLEWDASQQRLRLHFATALPGAKTWASPPGIHLIQQDADTITIGREP